MSDKKISELIEATSINQDDVSVLVSGGTDYKFAFATLLQFLGNSLTVGANINFGVTLPENTSGKNGDIFINTVTGSFAKKTTETWAIVYTIPSTSALTDGTVLYGLGMPGTPTGNNNDTYINTGTGIFYKKAGGTWAQVFSMQTGPQGPQGIVGTNGMNGVNGFSVLHGATNPSNLSTGVNGDFYINTGNYTLFGPKTASVWGDGVSLTGPEGEKGEKGDVGNTGGKGDKGDPGDTGPKGDAGDNGPPGAGGTKGDKGDKGDTGDTGPTGVTGPKGDNGDTGDTGPTGADGADGNSAYQIWLGLGHTGSEATFMASLVGATGAAGTSPAKATSPDINTGTDDAKFVTALGLEASKYVTQSGAKISATASGTNSYSATISPAITAYANTQRFYIRFTNANTSLTCTLALNGLSALPMVKGINTALAVGDIAADSIHLVAIDGTNARVLSLSSIPTVTSGEKVLTITSGGPQKTYDLQDLTVSSTSLTAADFSTGIASVTGLVGQLSYDSNYRYDCIGINQWRRSALNGTLVDLYLADIDDSAGDKTSSDLQTAYPSSLIGQQAWGVNKLYIKKTTTSWRKIIIATA